MTGRNYWSVRFLESQGTLAMISSQTEMVGRCPGFCRVYTLTTGNSNGVNVHADNTHFEFMIEPNDKKIRVLYQGRTDTYRVNGEVTE